MDQPLFLDIVNFWFFPVFPAEKHCKSQARCASGWDGDYSCFDFVILTIVTPSPPVLAKHPWIACEKPKKLLTRSSKRSHLTPILNWSDLMWSPAYIRDLLTPYATSESPTSSDQGLLVVVGVVAPKAKIWILMTTIKSCLDLPLCNVLFISYLFIFYRDFHSSQVCILCLLPYFYSEVLCDALLLKGAI